MFTLLERKTISNLKESKEKPEKEAIESSVIFKNVSFAYPSKPGKLILDQIDLVFEKGKKTAIVGESGCGKSTIISLIERFYEINSGTILLGDTDIIKYDLEYYRGLIGYVPQEPVLFNTSIKENIIFGRSGINESQLNEVIIPL